MITSLVKSLARVLLFWYAIGCLALFIGPARWAQGLYEHLAHWPFWTVPHIASNGILHAAEVQRVLIAYWTLPILALGALIVSMVVVLGIAFGRLRELRQAHDIMPRGEFHGVTVQDYSIGPLPPTLVPGPGEDVQIMLPGAPLRTKSTWPVRVSGRMAQTFAWLTLEQLRVAEEILSTLMADPEHYAGAGHGVGLLEHTLNVASEALPRCEEAFALPLVAALAHDLGKLITFVPNEEGGWRREGLHSRESARILAALPSFAKLPLVEQRALILCVKYDHAPSKLPQLAGDAQASALALRLMGALASADREATAAEKDRHLERLNPQDILWQDFCEHLREAQVVSASIGKKVVNQVNLPEGPYLYLYEIAWREEAVRRLPEEVAATLDLTRRDAGKLARYTTILAERLRAEGVLVEEIADDTGRLMHVSKANPLWNIRSGSKDKGPIIAGVFVLEARLLWQKIGYRIAARSPYSVVVLSANADQGGRIREPRRETAGERKLDAMEDQTKVVVTDDIPGLGSHKEGRRAPARTAQPVKDLNRPPEAPAVQEAPADDVPGVQSQARAEPAQVPTQADAQDDEPQLQGSEEPQGAQGAAATDASFDAAIAAALALSLEVQATAGRPPEAQDTQPPVEATGQDRSEAPSEPETAQSPESVAPLHQDAHPASSPGPGQVEGEHGRGYSSLTRAEQARGIAVADARACERYPHLQLGDKYYPDGSQGVAAGAVPGTRYEPSGAAKAIDVMKSAPAKDAHAHAAQGTSSPRAPQSQGKPRRAVSGVSRPVDPPASAAPGVALGGAPNPRRKRRIS